MALDDGDARGVGLEDLVGAEGELHRGEGRYILKWFISYKGLGIRGMGGRLWGDGRWGMVVGRWGGGWGITGILL